MMIMITTRMIIIIICRKSKKAAAEDRTAVKISYKYQQQYYRNARGGRKMYAWHGWIVSKLRTVCSTAA
jgi:hypothetical protein